ncbi:methionine--tRNA ligase subunit beta [Vulcanisaeta sp. JCM 16159]|uniref:methionine--tRNA ligase subunit beta n=1 Tax=Vulcanisaeta sp. JCM 16159 TaxID=1295371 RepID=UPI0006D2B87B|nr:methionine--tRNA ligase subunit beta [Vulcanisaeta sp. JCM 16159]
MSTETITRAEFEKVVLKVGKVIHAERVQGSKKLLRLIVDVGDERRQIITGLAEFYRPEDLINKYVVVVTNLESRKIFGYESQGMILASCDEKNPTIITIDKPQDEQVGKRVC